MFDFCHTILKCVRKALDLSLWPSQTLDSVIKSVVTTTKRDITPCYNRTPPSHNTNSIYTA